MSVGNTKTVLIRPNKDSKQPMTQKPPAISMPLQTYQRLAQHFGLLALLTVVSFTHSNGAQAKLTPLPTPAGVAPAGTLTSIAGNGNAFKTTVPIGFTVKGDGSVCGARVEYGDGQGESLPTYDPATPPRLAHTYATPGTFVVEIKGSTVESTTPCAGNPKLTLVVQSHELAVVAKPPAQVTLPGLGVTPPVAAPLTVPLDSNRGAAIVKPMATIPMATTLGPAIHADGEKAAGLSISVLGSPVHADGEKSAVHFISVLGAPIHARR
jgi:hypothetical protein